MFDNYLEEEKDKTPAPHLRSVAGHGLHSVPSPLGVAPLASNTAHPLDMHKTLEPLKTSAAIKTSKAPEAPKAPKIAHPSIFSRLFGHKSDSKPDPKLDSKLDSKLKLPAKPDLKLSSKLPEPSLKLNLPKTGLEIKPIVKTEIKTEVKTEVKKAAGHFNMSLHPHKKAAPSAKSNKFLNPRILDVDLIKDEIDIEFNWRKNIWIMVGLIFLALIMAGEVYFTLYLWQNNEIFTKSESLRKETQYIDGQIATIKAQSAEAVAFKDRLTFVNNFFANHIYWTDFFRYLEKNTLADVSYSGFSGDTTGSYNLKSLVSDFRAIGVQLQTFSTDPDTQTAAVADQKIDNGQQATSTELSGEPNVGVHFTLNLVIRKSLFNE